jgi:surfactin synthase thioesterase subunit
MSPVPQWFVGPPTRAAGTPLLLCLPPAGSGPSCFHGWYDHLPPELAVRVLALPGRESRITEPPEFVLEELVDAVLRQVDGRPYAMYGHSLGGLLAFELTRELRRRGGPLPVRLYLGASRPAHLPGTMDHLADAPDDEVLAKIAGLGGLPAQLHAVPELRDLFLLALRADLRWLGHYTHRAEEPLPVPLVGLAGNADHESGPTTMAGWDQHTTAGFVLHTLPGGHMFMQDLAAEAAALVGGDLGAATRSRSALVGTNQPDQGRMPMSSQNDAERLLPLGRGGWRLWRQGALRAAGFPADELLRLAAPELAVVADNYLAGTATDADLRAALTTAVARSSKVIYDQAGDPLFREAVTWQNLNALIALDGVRRGGPDEPSREKRRYREQAIARYWQRYCAKNDTIGFFGPICWVDLSDGTPNATVRPGPALTRRRWVSFEWRALAAFGERLATDPEVRRWLPAGLQPQLCRSGDRQVLVPATAPVTLTRAEAAVVDRLDGRRPVVEVAAELVAEEPGQARGLRKDEDVYLLLDQLVGRGLLWWGTDLPMTAQAEQRLRELIDGFGDPVIRRSVAAEFGRLCRARDEVAAAAGDPDRLGAAIATLHTEFAAVTGAAAVHRTGETYAGRAVCFEDTVRDLDVLLGSAVLDSFAEPLTVLLTAARWLTAAIADAYGAAFAALYTELATELGTSEVPFAELWFLAQGLLFGEDAGDGAMERPVDQVSAELAERFARLVGLDNAPPDTRVLQLRAADLAPLVAELFPATGPGWSTGRIHSPDLQFCADSVAALDRGDVIAVLGELHAAWSTLDSAVLVSGHEQPERLREWLAADLGTDRVRLLFPPSSPRHTARVGFALHHRSDAQLSFLPAPGADVRLVPITALHVRQVGGELLVDGAGRGPWPLLEAFAELLSMHAADAFKLVVTRPHTPRIMIDRLVAVRETWRTTVAESGLAGATGSHDRYLAVRRWRRDLGLPEQVYVKLASETKPCYVDLTSPVLASSLCAMVRVAQQEGGGQVSIVVTEALPGPEQAWVPDRHGRRYQSELRLQVIDPAPARTAPVIA